MSELARVTFFAKNRMLVTPEGATFVFDAWLGSYDRAIAAAASVFGMPRAKVRFSHIDGDGLWFDLSPQQTPPPGFTWRKIQAPVAAEPKRVLQQLAQALGFALFGVTRPQLPAPYGARFSEWLQDGAHAGMDFLARKASERLDHTRVQPDAQSVIVLATPYAPAAPKGSAKVARYAAVRDYHAVIPPRLEVIKRALRRFGSERNFVSNDTGAVLERAYAEQAGIGWIGKNGMLISRSHGSYIVLATVWTRLALPIDAPHAEFCGICEACRPACPAQAITQPAYVDARKCISYWTIEHQGPLPPGAPPLHDWAFGCDACQEGCPWNRFAADAAIAALGERRALPLDAAAWQALDGAHLQALLNGTPLRRAGAAGLLRNTRALLRLDE